MLTSNEVLSSQPLQAPEPYTIQSASNIRVQRFPWVVPSGQNWMQPGERHILAIGPLVYGAYIVTARPWSTLYDHHALAVESLTTATDRYGNPSVNFALRNASNTAIQGYDVYVCSISFA